MHAPHVGVESFLKMRLDFLPRHSVISQSFEKMGFWKKS